MALVMCGSSAEAEVELWNKDGLKTAFSLTLASGYFHAADANFGAGRDSDGATSIDWAEGYITPQLTTSFDTGRVGSFYGGLSYVGSATRGEGDAGDFTARSAEALDNEYLYIGWKSGMLLEVFGHDALDVSFGRQEFQVGDGFLLWDGNFDEGNEGTYRLLARSAFKKTALVRTNTQPLRGDLF
ncbi:MAG: alginate export family protein, partial [Candidatus Binatia bacterium]